METEVEQNQDGETVTGDQVQGDKVVQPDPSPTEPTPEPAPSDGSDGDE